ncbi:MAG TPA: molybdopterin-dependent oxidoreductase [Candidatus Acidoferrales bacterium]|nr:molybdopterin-dependent oxidoreductase [Candidatus Acidoferrales bacterium]
MPKIIIDGREIEAPANAMLLPVALENGVHVPHYCWHAKLSVDGSCRMCQVEVEGSPKLVIACNTPVRDGMVVRTQTPAVQNARRGVMELLLVNHPLDCPICDKAGECLLQDYSYAFGSRATRTKEPRRKLQKRKEIGPRMILDQERCILCRRCVRFCREITHTNELGVFNMGDRTVLDVMEGQPLANDYSINTADICPVGALESKDFHHKLRVWFLKKTPSVCPSCSNGCNVTIHHYRDRIWRMMPRRNDAVNETWMCDNGRLNYQFVGDEARLRQPLLRRAGELQPATWNEAVAQVAQRLRDTVRTHGADGVGIIASPHLTNEELFRLHQLVDILGVKNVDVATVVGQGDNLLIKPEKAANARGARDMGLTATGTPGLSGMIEAADAGKLHLLYVLGADVLKLVDPQLLKRGLAKVGCLIVQDVFHSPLTEAAHVVLPSLTWAEKTGTFTNVKGRVQQIHRAVAPRDEQPSDGEVFSRLLSQLGEGQWSFEPTAVLGEIAAAVPAYAGLSFARVGAQGYALPEAAGGAA